MKNFYREEIARRKKQQLYRQLVEADVAYKDLICFASNDYFGLAQNAAVKKAASDAIRKYGVGAGASRYVSGNNSLYTKLEKQLARMKKSEEAIVFSSGYACAIGVIPALVCEGDLIVADRLIHASLIDGAKLSGAKLMRFLHNDVAHARKILAENRGKFKKCLIVTETVFSMDGDLGKIDELLKLAKEFNAILVSDDAHGLEPSLTFNSAQMAGFLQLGTLSKAVGTLGGYVTGDCEIIDYLRNFARSQIYSTALPASILAASLAALKIIEHKNPAKKTLKNAEYFCRLMNLSTPQSAIVPLIIGDSKKTLEIAQELEKNGFLVGAIRYPTVEKNKARLRITFSAQHKKSDIKKLASILLKIGTHVTI